MLLGNTKVTFMQNCHLGWASNCDAICNVVVESPYEQLFYFPHITR